MTSTGGSTWDRVGLHLQEVVREAGELDVEALALGGRPGHVESRALVGPQQGLRPDESMAGLQPQVQPRFSIARPPPAMGRRSVGFGAVRFLAQAEFPGDRSPPLENQGLTPEFLRPPWTSLGPTRSVPDLRVDP